MAERTPREFWLQAGPPQQGKASSLAGVAEPGDILTVTGHGQYTNVGTRAEPNWQPYVPTRSRFFVVTSQEFARLQRDAVDDGPKAQQEPLAPRVPLVGRKPR